MALSESIKDIQKYALVIGAGASFSSHGGEGRPPLDLDFLKRSKQNLGSAKIGSPPRQAWDAFIRRLSLVGLNERWYLSHRLEQLTTYLEARGALQSLQLKQGRPAQYEETLAALKKVICWTLMRSGGLESCPLHKKIVLSINPSSIVSFNYDLIMDQTLFDLRRLPYWLKEYAGASLFVPNGNTSGHYSRPLPDWSEGREIPYFKLHGSINWREHVRRDGYAAVLGRYSSDETARWEGGALKLEEPPESPMIVPPIAAKMNFRSDSLKGMWKNAAKLLKAAPGWIFWGYSFPPTDTLTHVMLRIALVNNRKKKPIIVVNPDPSLVERIEGILQKVNVVGHFNSAEHFLFHYKQIKI